MRARALFAVASALAITAATAATAADATDPKSSWEGFGVGSWVQRKTTAKTSAPGLSLPEEASETRETLIRVTDDVHTIKRESKTATGLESSREISYPRRDPVPSKPDDDPASKVEREDLGTEKVVVEGKGIDCKKTRTMFANTTMTTWTSSTYGVLKSEIDGDAGGGRSHDTRTVTALAKKVKLAGKDLVCRETTLFTRMDLPGVPLGGPGDGTTGVELESDAVPGRRVRMEMTGKRGPVTRTSVEELTAFEAKRP